MEEKDGAANKKHQDGAGGFLSRKALAISAVAGILSMASSLVAIQSNWGKGKESAEVPKAAEAEAAAHPRLRQAWAKIPADQRAKWRSLSPEQKRHAVAEALGEGKAP